MNNVVLFILDSCRYDSVDEKALSWLGDMSKRWSWSGWTLPSHMCMLSGLMPHTNEPISAARAYWYQFREWSDRTGIELEASSFTPSYWLPALLSESGYKTYVLSTVPCFNSHTALNRVWHFEDLFLKTHVGLRTVALMDGIRLILSESSEPVFIVATSFDTHYPYLLDNLPRVSGIRGGVTGDWSETGFFSCDLDRMKRAQADAASRSLIAMQSKMQETCAGSELPTHWIVTADHGELFGEEGYFGHGPFVHDKLFEVPFAEGLIK